MPHISRSWHRRRLVTGAGAADPAPLSPARFGERRAQAMRLLERARPGRDGLTEHATAHGCVVILTDAGGPDFPPKTERVALNDTGGRNRAGDDVAYGGRAYLPAGAATTPGERAT